MEAAELTTYNFNINAMESQSIQRPRKNKNTVKIKDLEDIEKDTNIMVIHIFYLFQKMCILNIFPLSPGGKGYEKM